MTDSPDHLLATGQSTTARQTRLSAKLLVTATALILLPAYLLSLVVFGLPNWWIADLFVHFKLHYLVAGCLGLVLFGVMRRPWLTAAAAVTVAVNLMPVLHYFDTGNVPAPIGPANAALSSALKPETAGGASAPLPVDADQWAHFRIASANIYKHNERFDLVADWINRNQPDVVVLLEARNSWQREMKKRLPNYAHQVLVAGPRRVGKLVISNIPLDDMQKIPSTGKRSPVPVITLRAKQAAFKMFALHASFPLKKQWAADRNEELAQLARSANDSTLPFVALGDFNITPFSRYFQQTLRDGKLRRAAAGRGWLPTWPTFFLPAGIQIDHILTDAQVQVTDYQVGGGLNSDHRWVMADIAVPRQAVTQ